jgi:hypothetical protein
MVDHNELQQRLLNLRNSVNETIKNMDAMLSEAPHLARFIDLDQFLARLDAARENLQDAKKILGVD